MLILIYLPIEANGKSGKLIIYLPMDKTLENGSQLPKYTSFKVEEDCLQLINLKQQERRLNANESR